MRYGLVSDKGIRKLVSVEELENIRYDIVYKVYDKFEMFLEINAPDYLLSQSTPMLRYRRYLKEFKEEINEINGDIVLQLMHMESKTIEVYKVSTVKNIFDKIFPGEVDKKKVYVIIGVMK